MDDKCIMCKIVNPESYCPHCPRVKSERISDEEITRRFERIVEHVRKMKREMIKEANNG